MQDIAGTNRRPASEPLRQHRDQLLPTVPRIIRAGDEGRDRGIGGRRTLVAIALEQRANDARQIVGELGAQIPRCRDRIEQQPGGIFCRRLAGN